MSFVTQHFTHLSRSVLAIGLAVVFLALAPGCDTGKRNSDEGGDGFTPVGPSGPGGILSIPVLFSMEPDLVCPGQVVTLRGINFDTELQNNVVLFRAGTRTIPGMPLNVGFPADTNLADGRDSVLRVIVPTGVLTGTVELNVNGFFAGAIGFLACPQIISYEIDVNRDSDTLVHGPPLGFDISLGAETVWIHGLNFTELTSVRVEDSGGRSLVLGPANFRRRRLDPDNGLDSISFSLENARFNIASPRDNISVVVRTDEQSSNRVYVPVKPLADVGTPLGAVINGTLLPAGVRTGPVRILYTIYDRPINMSYEMNVEWSADGGTEWFPAQLDFDDPMASGVSDSIPNVVLPGSFLFPSLHTVLRGGGDLKVFTWDAHNDVNFRELNESTGANGNPAPRNWSIQFRMAADLAFNDGNNTRNDPGVLFETPTLAYFDVLDRPGSDASSLRQGVIEERFRNSTQNDTQLSDALWGPPFNTGALQGALENRAVDQFGLGTFDLVLSPLFEPPEFFFSEHFLFDTTRMQISRIIVLDEDEDGTPDVEQASAVWPTLSDPNPGEDDGEFHLRTLVVEPGVEVRTRGSEPLTIRLSGQDLVDTDIVMQVDGLVDLDGENATGIQGGQGRLGAGSGGNGAELAIDATLAVSLMVNATPGGLNGGGAGDTPGAIEWDRTNPNAQTRFNASPGGGGGNRTEGGIGDPGEPRPETYELPDPGAAGPVRGNEYLLPLSPGSGGGGGGASITGAFATGAPGVFPGGGGGAGGGALAVYARGSIAIGDGGLISANGGDGANAAGPNDRAGPGGGGSGGCVLLRSTGFIEATCESFSVIGGQPGPSASTMNRIAGAGVGGEGWVRLETRFGGIPFCSDLPDAQTTLSANLRRSSNTNSISLASTDSFPPRGTITIDDEEITYGAKDDTSDTLSDITRAVNGTILAEHTAGAEVFLQAVLAPARSFITGGITASPDVIDTKLGLDQSLHCTFIPSLDPGTGELLLDERGRVQSVWRFNTDTGVVTTPQGLPSKFAINASENPGQLQLTRLTVDPGVTLRGEGSRPMSILVTEIAEIFGTIDVSGEDGGLLRFSSSTLGQRNRPEAGLGGGAGPAGGAGGNGGMPLFLNDDVTDKSLANVDSVPGLPGELSPVVPEAFDRTENLVGGAGSQAALGFLEVTRSAGGGARLDPDCGTDCTDTAGGGGGGGNLEFGVDGQVVGGGDLAGVGGSHVGVDSLRFNGGLFLTGGSGGAGGGPSSNVSQAYKNRQTGSAIFRGEADYAPGTGGGGGGGVLHLAVRGSLTVHAGAKILANGGDAYQSIDLGGNGGGGAGGTILIQAVNALKIEPGSRIEARGGRANLAPPRELGSNLPLHEGNFRNGTATGGLGGAGAAGRIRIEASESSTLLDPSGVINESIYGGVVAPFAEPSVGVSRPYRMGIGPGLALLTHELEVVSQLVNVGEFGVPEGTRVNLLWQRAPQDLDNYATVGPFEQLRPSIEDLNDGEYVRFQAHFESNNIIRLAPQVRRIRVEYELPVD